MIHKQDQKYKDNETKALNKIHISTVNCADVNQEQKDYSDNKIPKKSEKSNTSLDLMHQARMPHKNNI